MRALLAALALGALAAAAAAEPAAHAGAARALPVDAAPRRASLEERLAEIRRRVQRALDYPALDRARERSGEAVVRFEIGPDSRARDVVVVRSSGIRGLDVAAARAVVAAGELPWVYGSLEIPVRFELEAAGGAPAQP